MIQSISADRCVGCGRCQDCCPLDVFRLQDGISVIAYPDDCMACYLCEYACPTGAIFVHPFKVAAPPVFPGILETRKGGGGA